MQSSNYSSLEDVLNQMDTKTGIYGITAITLGLFPFSMIRAVLFFSISLKASIKLHNKMFQSVTRAPLLFFQSNPIGIVVYTFYQLE
jgi:ATP-binding cassette subfamily C (CFTR/MRP) protein 4